MMGFPWLLELKVCGEMLRISLMDSSRSINAPWLNFSSHADRMATARVSHEIAGILLLVTSKHMTRPCSC